MCVHTRDPSNASVFAAVTAAHDQHTQKKNRVRGRNQKQEAINHSVNIKISKQNAFLREIYVQRALKLVIGDVLRLHTYV